MERYTYNKELIEKLNIKYFIEKYNLNNEKYNLAIFMRSALFMSIIVEKRKRYLLKIFFLVIIIALFIIVY